MAKRKSTKTAFPQHKASAHANHMCELVAKRQMDKVALYSKGAKYICHICGRAAARPANLCEPVKI